MKPSEFALKVRVGFYRDEEDPPELARLYDDLAGAYLRLREAAQDVAKVTSGAVVKRLRDVLEERDDG
jgi:hypothetical protein